MLHRFVDSRRRGVDGCFSFVARTHRVRQDPLGLVILPPSVIQCGLTSEPEGSRKRLRGEKP